MTQLLADVRRLLFAVLDEISFWTQCAGRAGEGRRLRKVTGEKK